MNAPKDATEFAAWAYQQRGGIALVAARIAQTEQELNALKRQLRGAQKTITELSDIIAQAHPELLNREEQTK